MLRLTCKSLLFSALLCSVLGVTAKNLDAQTPPPSAMLALQRLVSSPTASADWFTPAFLAQVPVPQVQAILDRLREALGDFQGTDGSGSEYTLRFQKGTLPATIAVNGSGQITSLLFGNPTFFDRQSAYQQSLDSIRQLPGKVSLLITKNGAEQTSINPNDRLAVGSAFKLSVLMALKDQIDQNKVQWDDVVRLNDESKSLPTGILQAWPSGSAVTVQTLASLMISVSDNTAADSLIDLVGRENAERYSFGNTPFLKTREAFVLKSAKNGDLLDRYLKGDIAAKRTLLQETTRRPLPGVTDLDTGERGQSVEWFYTVGQLCGLIDMVADLPPMRINPGVADNDTWRQVAFKGGSDAAVINLTHQLTAADGTKWCVSVSWNDDSADQDTLVPYVRSLIASLAP